MGKIIMNGVEYVGGNGVLLKSPTYVYHGGHHDNTSIRFTYANNTASPFPKGNDPFTVEVFYNAYERDVSVDPYVFSVGSGDVHQVIGIAVKRIVTYGDDWDAFGSVAYGVHHKVITYDGNVTMKYYLDGSYVGSHTLSASLNIQPLNVAIGAFINGQEALTGDIYFVKFYGSEFSASEAQQLYNQRCL